ncbi:MAG: PhoD-like phosphatase N-terminal domain-containing protein [Sphingobacteriales bacterium JAD_PAG50586_3]|nr:MAG: PhoD-like phosphatase N-terminal domain-containing protein [Sphingobacteriales bacterium JAD_PAG50586_3]
MKKLVLIAAFAVTSLGLFAQEGPSLQLPDTRADVDPQFAPFYHGVASGDPLSDRVIIWTRLSDYVGASIPLT